MLEPFRRRYTKWIPTIWGVWMEWMELIIKGAPIPRVPCHFPYDWICSRQKCPPAQRPLLTQCSSLKIRSLVDILDLAPWTTRPSQDNEVRLSLFDILHGLFLDFRNPQVPAWFNRHRFQGLPTSGHRYLGHHTTPREHFQDLPNNWQSSWNLLHDIGLIAFFLFISLTLGCLGVK